METTKSDRQKAMEQKAAAVSEQRELEIQLHDVSLRVSRAQDRLKQLEYMPKQPETSYYDDRRQAKDLVPETAAAKIGEYRRKQRFHESL